MKRTMRLSKQCSFEACHKIPGHPICGKLHGHSYKIGISLSGVYNSTEGMLVDFGEIKKIVNQFDHSYLNDRFKFPSAENLAIYLSLKILRLNRDVMEVTVTVYETESACATHTAFNIVFEK